MKIVTICFMAFAMVLGTTDTVRAEDAHQRHHHEADAAPAIEAPASGLTETGKVLPSSILFRAATAYQIAEEMPQTLDALYCYCNCKENPTLLHKTLLTCYTSDHAAKCGICMHEAEMASGLTKQGKGIPEIRAAVDAFYKAKEKEKK